MNPEGDSRYCKATRETERSLVVLSSSDQFSRLYEAKLSVVFHRCRESRGVHKALQGFTHTGFARRGSRSEGHLDRNFNWTERHRGTENVDGPGEFTRLYRMNGRWSETKSEQEGRRERRWGEERWRAGFCGERKRQGKRERTRGSLRRPGA